MTSDFFMSLTLDSTINFLKLLLVHNKLETKNNELVKFVENISTMNRNFVKNFSSEKVADTKNLENSLKICR